MAVSVLGLDGPPEPTGPVASLSMTQLLTDLRASQGGQPLQCFPTCWKHVALQSRSLLIAVGYERVACYHIADAEGSLSAAGSLRIDLTLQFLCSHPSGQYQRGADALLGVALTDLERSMRMLRITVRTRTEGAPFTTIGTTALRLP